MAEESTPRSERTGDEAVTAQATVKPKRRRVPVPRRRQGPVPTTDQARRRLLGLLGGTRPDRGQLVAAGLLALLGVALVAQVRSTEEAGLGQLRQSELVALLDDASERVDVLQEEVLRLEADKEQLQGLEGDEAAVAAAAERLESYTILAGTVPVEGPGITVYVSAPEGAITQTMLLDAIQELRDAGAEAIQIGSQRVVASTWVGTDADGRLTLNGTVLTPPFRIAAIGEAHTLAGAMAIPGGFSDTLRGAGAKVEVVETDALLISAVQQSVEPRFARPVPSSPDR